MRAQVRNTLRSLHPTYQQGITERDYEVILLENSSEENMSEVDIRSLPQNFRYILRQDSSVSPAAAINEGFSLARGEFIGLMIDGAYILTPGVLRYALLAYDANPEAFVTVPTYHLGPASNHKPSRRDTISLPRMH